GKEDGVGNPVKMHAHKELLTGALKGKIGFDGFVISDWADIQQIPGDYATQVRTSVNAGVDMFMEPYSAPQFVETLLAEVRAGRVKTSRIDDAVRRILKAKFELGLFERPDTDRRHAKTIGSPAHRAVGRKGEAVAHRRRRHAPPEGQVRARPVRAPVHRPQARQDDRLARAPRGGPQGRRRVAGPAEEPRSGAAAEAQREDLRRRRQRRR